MGTIIVTGAFGVLGQAVVTEMVDRGHIVAGIDLAPAPKSFGGALAVGGLDLADEQSVRSAYSDVAGKLGPIDGMVNVAGGFVWDRMEGGDLGNWDRMHRINLTTALISSLAVLPHFAASGAAIVNIGAAGASPAGLGMAPYAASKAAVRALTESLAAELGERGIRVNAVLPTIIDTPTNRADMPEADTSGWVKPGAAARVIAFLLSPDSAAISGAMIPLNQAGLD